MANTWILRRGRAQVDGSDGIQFYERDLSREPLSILGRNFGDGSELIPGPIFLHDSPEVAFILEFNIRLPSIFFCRAQAIGNAVSRYYRYSRETDDEIHEQKGVTITGASRTLHEFCTKSV